MNYNKIFSNGFLASSIIMGSYEQLMELACNDMDDTYEYLTLIGKLNNRIKAEDEVYKSLSLDEVNEYFDAVDPDKLSTSIDERYYNKLSNRKKALVGEPKIDDDTLLSTVIDSKIIIDTFKELYRKMEGIEFSYDIDPEMLANLMSYHKTSKYTYLSSNNYLEKLSIAFNFDVEKIPAIDFRSIERTFNVDFYELSKSIFIYHILEEVYYLINPEPTSDEALRVYTELLSMTRIEVILSYLNQYDMRELTESLKEEYSGISEDNKTLSEVKKLIKQRKEELNK